MVKIRMTRLGRHKLPFYRIVAVDSRNKRDGGYIALIGTYEPFEGKIDIKEDLVIKFLMEGAQPSDTVRSFLKDKGIWKKFVDQKLNLAKNKSSENKKDKPKKAKSVKQSKSKDSNKKAKSIEPKKTKK